MSSGFEVCIHRDGRWEVYSFFETHEENDAIYQARDISNNYNAVCVLWSSEMRVSYFKSRNPKDKKPKYMDVRADLKLGRKKEAGPAPAVKSVAKPKAQEKPQKEEKEKDPHFTRKDKQRAFLNSMITGGIGFVLTFFSPALLSANASSTLKGAVMATTFIISAFLAYIVYQITEQSARHKNEGEDIDSDLAWRNIGLSEDVLEKLAKEKSPEMTTALSSILPDIENTKTEIKVTPSLEPKAVLTDDTTSSSNLKEGEPSEVHFSPEDSIENSDETSDRIKAAIATKPINHLANPAHDNSNFSLSQKKEQDNKPETDNALAEASLRELLTEMCRTIKSVSHDKETFSLKDTHELAAVLYLCGAASFAVRHLSLSQNLVNTSVPLVLTRLDVNPEISENFVNQLGNYIHTPRHAILFDRGVSDAKLYIDNNGALFTYEDALNKWLALQGEASSNSFFASILFTDIEDFTESTRVNGDNWMVDVLHAHNDIIRKVLAQYRGQEIKHTGDGILAMFNNVNKAVEAAITIQRGFDLFSKAMPSRAFKARVAIGAGNIVSIDGDIFGGSVNLTARVMSLAKGGQISITEAVHGIVKEGSHSFTDLGEQELKGCKKQHIHLVNWEKLNHPNTASVDTAVQKDNKAEG